MSSIHCLLGLPWWRKPSILPSKTVCAKFPALPLVTCPKYCSFIRANFPINSLSRPISSNIDILVRCSFQKIPGIFLQHHISKDSILFLSDFFTTAVLKCWTFCMTFCYCASTFIHQCNTVHANSNSVHLSLCLSVTHWYCVKTAEPIVKILSHTHSSIILVVS